MTRQIEALAKMVEVGGVLAKYEERLAELRRCYLTEVEAYRRTLEGPPAAAPGYNPEWPAQLEELSQKLRRIPPAVAGTDGFHVDLVHEVAKFLATTFDAESTEVKDPETHSAGVRILEASQVVSNALANAEERRARAVRFSDSEVTE